MATQSPQTFANHARYEPLFHFVLGGLLAGLLAWTVRGVLLYRTPAASFQFLLVVALIVTAWFARAFALTAQDRVIRLEMRLRLQALAPQLMPRFEALAPDLLVALRFAGDGELPGLVQQVLDGTLKTSDQIKRQIKDWKADLRRV